MLYIVLFLFFFIEEAYFIDNMREEAQFYDGDGDEDPSFWLFGRGGTIIFIYIFFLQNHAGCCLEFHFIYGPCSTWRAGQLDQVILLVRPY